MKINITALAALLTAWQATNKKLNLHHKDYENKINEIIKDLPSGNGIEDSQMDWINSNPRYLNGKSQKIMFICKFHHMNENGFYDGYTNHKITVLPIFGGFDVIVRGTNRDDIKSHLQDVWMEAFEI